ncbi:MAG: hypothetical protein ACREX3_19685 [Gammaproteobacteria bacterium]
MARIDEIRMEVKRRWPNGPPVPSQPESVEWFDLVTEDTVLVSRFNFTNRYRKAMREQDPGTVQLAISQSFTWLDAQRARIDIRKPIAINLARSTEDFDKAIEPDVLAGEDEEERWLRQMIAELDAGLAAEEETYRRQAERDRTSRIEDLLLFNALQPRVPYYNLPLSPQMHCTSRSFLGTTTTDCD